MLYTGTSHLTTFVIALTKDSSCQAFIHVLELNPRHFRNEESGFQENSRVT